MASNRFDPAVSSKITKFILFNYDNLIADYYEPFKPYLSELSLLLSQGTGVPTKNIFHLLNDESLSKKAHPVQYLKDVDAKIETFTGYYFLSK